MTNNFIYAHLEVIDVPLCCVCMGTFKEEYEKVVADGVSMLEVNLCTTHMDIDVYDMLDLINE